MRTFTATEAKNRFGELLDATKNGPVRIQKNGRDVGFLVSPDEYAAHQQDNANGSKMRPEVRAAMERSMKRRAKLYEALAK
ncbi:MAG: type II toxin-antitoxin system Phd/YefM family antitoxin [Pseudomonadota bacterium]